MAKDIVVGEDLRSAIDDELSEATSCLLSIAQLTCFDGSDYRHHAIRALAQKGGWAVDRAWAKLGRAGTCGSFEEWLEQTHD